MQPHHSPVPLSLSLNAAPVFLANTFTSLLASCQSADEGIIPSILHSLYGTTGVLLPDTRAPALSLSPVP